MTTVVHPGDSLSPKQRLVYILVLGALTALGPFTVDLYLPAFPALEDDFAATTAVIQLTLTATAVGFGFGQLLVGPWSDRVGRRLPLVLATSLHVAASLGVAFAPDIVTLGVFRVLQGFGAAAGGVVAMAMVRDLFGGLPLVRMLSRLALVNGLAPILAPVIGSQLLVILDWRGIFYFLAAYGFVVVLSTFLFIVETLPPARRVDTGHATVRERYRSVLTDRTFVGVAVISAMTFSGLFAYLSSSSFLFQEIYGLNPQEFGLLFAVNSIGVVLGVQASAGLARYVGPQWILAVTTAVLLVSALLIIVFDSAHLGLLGIVIPLWFFLTACGFGFPLVQVLALVNHPREAGTAASVLGALNFGLAGLTSPIAGLFGIHDAVPMGAVMAVTAVFSVLALWFVVRPWTVPRLAR
ncbi:multidrug effflux MFS transporter [Parafrigoribacterium mesophilum]|uniref:multidrug effflux MFS transporter n=1 Tax=Parafrigoribacterium mesophilum TaxID=433646 RepID=UPI0031FCA226